MTADTADLANKQDNLISAIGKIAPMIQKADGMLEKLKGFQSQ